MNFFGGFGNGYGHKDCDEGRPNNCLCDIIWIIFLLQLCGGGCGERGIMQGCDCCDIVLLLILLSCICK